MQDNKIKLGERKTKEIELDPSKEIIVDLAIELPFWIPIGIRPSSFSDRFKSGDGARRI